MTRILICGDRDWKDRAAIHRELSKFTAPVTVIHGGAQGADTIAGTVAKSLSFEVLIFPADWDRDGLAAGPKRNMRMLDEGKPDLVLAFHSNLKESKGTKDSVAKARARGIEVRIFPS